ncbi:MAG: protein disulfide oxidoreductase, partial [Gammaproteobacteria bacterium]|nr:protein disulfide oxidoreductase [Gammaproteobacteria bacterium]
MQVFWQGLRRRAPGLLLQLLLLLLAVWALEAWMTRDAARGPAPAIVAQTLDGQSFTLSALEGQAAVVHFWAVWCPVCELEQGMIDRLASAYPVITVAMQSGSEAEVAAYLREQGVDYPVINDPDGALAALYGVRAVPASFVLDAQGQVRFVTRGYTSGWGMRLRLWLAG